MNKKAWNHVMAGFFGLLSIVFFINFLDNEFYQEGFYLFTIAKLKLSSNIHMVVIDGGLLIL